MVSLKYTCVASDYCGVCFTTQMLLMKKFVRPQELAEMIGVCRHTIYQWVRTGKFPEPVKLGPRASAWRVEDIERWIAERPTKNEARMQRTSAVFHHSSPKRAVGRSKNTPNKNASAANAGAEM